MIKNLILFRKRKSSLGYKYYSNVGLALPKPELEVIHYTKEFVDKFKTRDVLNLGFGLFDDGINLEKKFAVALVILSQERLVQAII